MNNEHIKGALDQLVGKTKETAGHLSGDRELEAEGVVDQVKGSLHNAVGDIKDLGREVLNRVKASTGQ